MKILPETRRRAFYEGFRHAAGISNELELQHMEAAWAGSGLRRSDLFNTLRELSADHLVVLDDSSTGQRIRLTHPGQDDEQRIRRQLLARLRDVWILWRVGARPPGSTARAPAPHRRRDDRPPIGSGPQSCRT